MASSQELLERKSQDTIQDALIDSLYEDPRVVVVGGVEKVILDSQRLNRPVSLMSHDLDIYAFPAHRSIYGAHRLESFTERIIPDSLPGDIVEIVPHEGPNWPGMRMDGDHFTEDDDELRLGNAVFTEQVRGNAEDQSTIACASLEISDRDDAEVSPWIEDRKIIIAQKTTLRVFPNLHNLLNCALLNHNANLSTISKSVLRIPVLERRPERMRENLAILLADLDAPALKERNNRDLISF